MQADTSGNIQNDIIHIFATFELYFETDFDVMEGMWGLCMSAKTQFKESGRLKEPQNEREPIGSC